MLNFDGDENADVKCEQAFKSLFTLSKDNTENHTDILDFIFLAVLNCSKLGDFKRL